MIKKGKRIKMKQHDEASAGAVMPSKEDIQEEIDSKIKLRIRTQSDLRKQYLSCMYTNVELEELRAVYNTYDKKNYGKFELFNGTHIEGEWKFEKNDKGELLYGYIETSEGEKHKAEDIKITHKLYTEKVDIDKLPKDKYGLPYSKNLLRWEYEIKENLFSELVAQLNHMVSEITKLGFTKKQIEDIKYKGIYIKDVVKLENMEETWLKENNPGWGIEEEQ